MRQDKNVVELYPEWKTKKNSGMSFMDTHKNLFNHVESNRNSLRESKLRLEDKRDRPYNFINGEAIDII